MKEKKLPGSLFTRSFRAGSYSFLSALIVIAVAAALVLLVGALPTRYTAFDMTSDGVYSLSELTETKIGTLEEDVDIYLLAAAGSEDTPLVNLLERYDALSDRLHVSLIDPVANPAFAKQFTDSLRYNNSLVVSSGSRNRFIDYTDIYVTDYSAYYSSYDENDIVTEFNAESVITSAVDFVTTEDLPVLYALTGHGETELNGSFGRAAENANLAVSELSLLTAEAVPEDCGCLFISSPTKDLSRNETGKIKAFLENGGRVLLFTTYTGGELPNLSAMMADFGCSLTDGIVLEQDRNHYVYGYADCLVPELEVHVVTAPLIAAGAYVVLPDAQGILSEEIPENITVTPLLTTSESAYVIRDFNDASYHAGDQTGAFPLAAEITAGEGRLIWFTSGMLLSEQYNRAFGGTNEDLFINTLNYLCERGENISLHPKMLGAAKLTLTTAQSGGLGALLTIFLPLSFAVCGAVVVIRRRRRA